MADFNSYIQSLMQNPNPQGGMMGTGRSSQLVTPEQLLQGRGADTYSYVADPFRAQNFIDSGQFSTQQNANIDAYNAGRESPAVFGMSAERQAAAAAAQQAAMQGGNNNTNGMLTPQAPPVANTAQPIERDRTVAIGPDSGTTSQFTEAEQRDIIGNFQNIADQSGKTWQSEMYDYNQRQAGTPNYYNNDQLNTTFDKIPGFDANGYEASLQSSMSGAMTAGPQAAQTPSPAPAQVNNTVLGNLPQYQMADVNLAQVYKDADAYAAAGRGTAADYVQLAGNTNNFSQFDIDNVLGGLKARGMFSNLS